ncbi:MAG: hypothetical protein SGBAC_000227 [Bacillariaceae sp.]
MTLLHDALEAYLGPLLKKHNDKTHLTWEDLAASKAAATKALEGSDNIFVSKKVDNLHEAQVKAYKEAGTKALKEWAEALSQEPMEEGDSKDTFVRRCVLAIRKAEPPLWPGVENAKSLIREEIQKRALATFEKYHPEGSEEGEAEPSEGDGGTEEGEQSEDGEAMTEEEDGEEEEGEVEQKPGKPAAAPKVKNKVNNKNPPKKKVVRKKGPGAKGGMRKNFAGNKRGKKNAPGNKTTPGNKTAPGNKSG